MIDLSWLQTIYWREPAWMLLAFQPLILVVIRTLSGKKNLSRFADPQLHAWVNWQSITPSKPGILPKFKVFQALLFSRNSFYFLSWILLATALSGPRFLLEKPDSNEAPVMNVMFVVDVSRSMQVRDISPNRLQRAQIEINELMQMSKSLRIGLILYTSRAHLLLPFTHDYQAAKYYVSLIDELPLPTRGSRPADALLLAAKEINNFGDETPSTIVWMSDGDIPADEAGGIAEIKNAIKILNARTIPLYIMGLGSDEGDAVPDVNKGWLEFQGRPVISRMNSHLLDELAQLGKGRFIITQNDDSDWKMLYQQGIANDIKGTTGDHADEQTLWQEFYPWFLLPAIVLLFISLMPYPLPTPSLSRKFLDENGSQNKSSKKLSSATVKVISTAFIFLTVFLLPNDASATDKEELLLRQAYQKYTSEKYKLSASIYHQLNGFSARLGEGNSYYRLDDYPLAITQFYQAVLVAKDDMQRGLAIYNLANATFMTGDYGAAATLYQDTLRYRPTHHPSQSNLKFSLSLQSLIDEQINNGMANRMGSGPQTARAEQGLDINSQGSMAFDNEEERKNSRIALPDIPQQELALLLAKGLANIHLANNKLTQNKQKHSNSLQWKQDVAAARLRMRELDDEQVFLWKRLFEIEEGFLAPLEEAETIPGRQAW